MFKLALSTLALVGAIYVTTGCSSNVKKVDYPVTANPTNEINAVKNDLNTAKSQQANVFAPDSYEAAEKHLAKAEKLSGKGAKSEEILSEVGYARAYLNEAQSKGAAGTQAFAEITTARQAALAAGAQDTQNKELNKLDDDLKDLTAKYEKKGKEISQKDKTDLQSRYLELELNSIRISRLGKINAQIESAKSMGARKLAPKTLASAEAKVKNAETVIVTDRHNEGAIMPAVTAAANESAKLVAVTQAAKGAKAGSTEDVALGIVGQQATISALDQQVDAAHKESSVTAAALAAKNAELNKTNAELGETQTEAQKAAAKLAAEQRFNAAFEEARQKFGPNEAEVYRQGNNLLIRMKNINFASGRSDLPAAAIGSLGKVKDIIKEMNAEKITVEGHTDSVGTKAVNEKLSQGRADAVAKYFETEKVIDSGNVEAVGYGFEKPLTSNKTKAGRAQNRRVDVIITPSTSL